MRIPSKDLDGFAAELVSRCMSSRQERITVYEGLKSYYLFGAQQGDQAPYGKIFPHIDLLTSYLYSQGTVEFDVAVQNVDDHVYDQAALITDKLNTSFHDYGVADLFSEAITWSLVWNTVIIKLNWTADGLEPYFVQPHNFGVLQESINVLSRQEAFCHQYTISEAQLRRELQYHPSGLDILRRISATPTQAEEVFPEAVNRMILGGSVDMTSTTTRGIINVPDLIQSIKYKPTTSLDEVTMYELWVWDDDKEDYRTITVAEPGVVIYGRESIGNVLGIKGEHPFIQVTPNRLPDYFWGWSEVTNLIKLQDWTSERLSQIRNILSKQANPPKALSGWGGITDEKIAAFGSPGSWMSDPTPNAKIEMLSPDMPSDLWHEITMIQGMYNDISGLADTLQGKGESGVRSKGQADILAKLGSSRIKKRALAIERSLEELGGLIVKIMRHKDDTRMFVLKPDGKKEPFVCAQFTDRFQVHVDAHSASPVFVDDHKQLAFALAKAQAIGPDSLLDLTRPPKVDQLKKRLREMQKAKAMQAKQMMELGIVPGGKKKAA